jgi:hypothetical protein
VVGGKRSDLLKVHLPDLAGGQFEEVAEERHGQVFGEVGAPAAFGLLALEGYVKGLGEDAVAGNSPPLAEGGVGGPSPLGSFACTPPSRLK